MRNYTIRGILFALIAILLIITPAFAHHNGGSHGGYHGWHSHPYYGHPNYGGGYYVNPNPYPYGYPGAYPVYNNYTYRGYAPYGEYGHYPYNRTARNVAIGTSIGAAVGLLASHHGHRYY